MHVLLLLLKTGFQWKEDRPASKHSLLLDIFWYDHHNFLHHGNICKIQTTWERWLLLPSIFCLVMSLKAGLEWGHNLLRQQNDLEKIGTFLWEKRMISLKKGETCQSFISQHPSFLIVSFLLHHSATTKV